MAGGRPLKYQTLKELETLIEAYFKLCKKNIIPYTITGLGLAIGLSRQQIIEYSNRDEFHDAIKEAKQRIENDYEISLRMRGSAGDIFGLKNFGWRDKQEVEQTGKDGGPIEHKIGITGLSATAELIGGIATKRS